LLVPCVKRNDYDYYRYLYLGHAVGLGTNVYNMAQFHALEALWPDDKLVGISYAMDAGHQQSATACCAFGISAKGRVVLLDTYYYSPAGQVNKKAPSQLSQDLHAFQVEVNERYKVQVIQRTIDSAEGALRNQLYLDWGEVWHPVAKLKNITMIEVVHSLLARGLFYYLDHARNAIFIAEHRDYRFDEKTIKTDDPRVVKEEDHTCDTLKYFAIDNAQLLGLLV
jgi:phage terminase large subunit